MRRDNFSLLNIPVIGVLFAILLVQCTSNEIANSKDVNPDKIYLSYSVSYAEGNTNADVYCQFRFGGKNGTTLVLTPPASIELDGEKLKADSNGTSGAYYRMYKPVNGFLGKHTLLYTDINKKQLENEFSVTDFKLVNVPAETDRDKPLSIPFTTAALNPHDYIELHSMNTDSSFHVTYEGTDTRNAIMIPVKELKRQKNNTLTLETRLYREVPLAQLTGEGGSLRIDQSLRPVKIRLN